jgi:hypothetical protein
MDSFSSVSRMRWSRHSHMLPWFIPRLVHFRSPRTPVEATTTSTYMEHNWPYLGQSRSIRVSMQIDEQVL